jgi:hypothetical protein
MIWKHLREVLLHQVLEEDRVSEIPGTAYIRFSEAGEGFLGVSLGICGGGLLYGALRSTTQSWFRGPKNESLGPVIRLSSVRHPKLGFSLVSKVSFPDVRCFGSYPPASSNGLFLPGGL